MKTDKCFRSVSDVETRLSRIVRSGKLKIDEYKEQGEIEGRIAIDRSRYK